MNSQNVNLYAHIHAAKPNYGSGMRLHFTHISAVLTLLDFKKIIDFGCGKGLMADELNRLKIAEVTKYDPAISSYNVIPNSKFDCIINTDVMEHIPESEIPAVLDQFKKLSSSAIIIPHLGKAKLILPNGENAHCTIKTPDEWMDIFRKKYRNVVQLSHSSNIHALFVCSDDSIPTEKLLRLSELITHTRISLSFKYFAETSSFSKRFSRAIRIIRGKRGFKNLNY